MISDDAAPDPVIDRAVDGYRTTLSSQAIRLACKCASVVLLARFVPPAEHGLFAMAASLTIVLVLFRDFGLGAAALHAASLSEEQKTTLFWLHASIGGGLTLVTVALAPAVGEFYREPRVQPLLFAMCGSMLLIGFNNWPRVLLTRELRFAELNQLETRAAVVSTLVMIAAAALGAGAYSFVVFLLLSETLLMVGAWRVCRWRPRAPLRWRSVSGLLRGGATLTGYNVLIHLAHQIDTLLMGRWFGAQPLGLYTRPAQMVMLPSLHIAAPLGQVLLATLPRLDSRGTSPARLVRETANLIAHLTLPIAAVCVAMPDAVVRIVFGPTWLDAAPLLRWLGLSAAASYVSATVYALCIATGHTSRLAAMSAISLAAIGVGIWLGRSHGPVGLAAGVALANVALVVPRLWWATLGTQVRLRALASGLARPLLLSCSLGAGLAGARRLAADLRPGAEIPLAIGGGLIAVAVVVTASSAVRDELRRVWTHRPGAGSR